MDPNDETRARAIACSIIDAIGQFWSEANDGDNRTLDQLNAEIRLLWHGEDRTEKWPPGPALDKYLDTILGAIMIMAEDHPEAVLAAAAELRNRG